MRTITLNDDDMREPCDHNNLATCGHCNRSWCDTCIPTPSARCPFEYEHEYDEPTDTDFPYRDDADDEIKLSRQDQEFAAFLANNDIKIDPNTPLAPHGGCNWAGCTTCFPRKDEVLSPREIWDIHNEGFVEEDEAQARRREGLLVAEAEEGYDVDKLVPRRLPHIGMSVCYHDDYHGEITEIFGEENPGMVKLDNGQVVDFEHCCEPLPHSIEHGPAHPCPVCGEYLGFHSDDMHRKNIDPKYLLEKGWHNAK